MYDAARRQKSASANLRDDTMLSHDEPLHSKQSAGHRTEGWMNGLPVHLEEL
jgi:hypothetical protein